jgi:hypothetical protein
LTIYKVVPLILLFWDVVVLCVFWSLLDNAICEYRAWHAWTGRDAECARRTSDRPIARSGQAKPWVMHNRGAFKLFMKSGFMTKRES